MSDAKVLTLDHLASLTWARQQRFTSVSATHARICAEAFDIAKADAVPVWLREHTFRVDFNPNCPSPYLVRLVAPGRGVIHGDEEDSRGYGQTLAEAAGAALDAKLAAIRLPPA